MAAVRLMWLGAVLCLAFIPLVVMNVDVMREYMYADVDIDPNDPAYAAFVDGFVVVFIVVMVLFYAVSAAAWLWMAAMNHRGRSWARITASVLGGVNLAACATSVASEIAVQVAPDLLGPSTGGAPMMALTVVYAGVSVAALVLLWRRPVSDYVRAVEESRRWEQWRSRQGQRAGSPRPGQ